MCTPCSRRTQKKSVFNFFLFFFNNWTIWLGPLSKKIFLNPACDVTKQKNAKGG